MLTHTIYAGMLSLLFHIYPFKSEHKLNAIEGGAGVHNFRRLNVDRSTTYTANDNYIGFEQIHEFEWQQLFIQPIKNNISLEFDCL